MKRALLIIIIFLFYMSFAWGEDINWDRLTNAVIQIESNGNPNAYNKKSGCIGLMQINPNGAMKEWNMFNHYTEPDYNEKDLYNPSINTKIGEWYIFRLFFRYNCDTIEKICAAYNGGIGRLRKNNYDINKMPSETKNYVKKVMKVYRDKSY